MAKKLFLCQSCKAINRVKLEESSGLVAHCGKCQAKLSMVPVLMSVEGQLLDKIIRNSELPVVIDIYADWCGPCKIYGPIFERVSKKMWQKAEFFKVDSERDPSLSAKYNIRGIPTTLIFHKGSLVKSQSGLLDESQLEGLIHQVVEGK